MVLLLMMQACGFSLNGFSSPLRRIASLILFYKNITLWVKKYIDSGLCVNIFLYGKGYGYSLAEGLPSGV